YYLFYFFFSSRRRHTRFDCDWSSDVCSSDLFHWFRSSRDPQRRNQWNGLSCGPPSDQSPRDPEWRRFYRIPLIARSVSPMFCSRSEERRVGKECRSRGSRYRDRLNGRDESEQ